MKHLLRTIIALSALSISASCLADTAQDQDRADLRKALQSIESALNEKAFDRITPFLSENAVVIFLNAEVTRDVDQARAYFDKTLGSNNAILSDFRTKAEVGAPARFFGHIAVADGSTQDTYVFATGSELEIDTKWSVTLEKQSHLWKIVQLHFSSNVFDNPLVHSAKNNLIMISAAAALIGIAAGFLLGRRRRTHG